MKTKEFEKMTFVYDRFLTLNGIMVFQKNKEEMFANVSLKELNKFTIWSDCPKELAQAILDYAYTPLEEREKEKKYYLMFPKDFLYSENACLNFDRDEKRYCKCSKQEYINYKTKFTQKEIDEMPFDTKFFEKVEC